MITHEERLSPLAPSPFPHFVHHRSFAPLFPAARPTGSTTVGLFGRRTLAAGPDPAPAGHQGAPGGVGVTSRTWVGVCQEGQQAARRVNSSYVSQLSVSNALTKHKHHKTVFSLFFKL